MRPLLTIGLIVLFILVGSPSADADWGDLMKSLNQVIRQTTLDDKEITAGLRDALRVGSERAVVSASRLGGFFENPDIRIRLPGPMTQWNDALRLAGFGGVLDRFELNMNRAAEKAAPEARAIFLAAVRDLSFSSARKILQGADNEATLYFKDKTGERLRQVFQPIVHQAMLETEVTAIFQQIADHLRTLPVGHQMDGYDLTDYVTRKTLDGLFFLLAEEERQIRTNPAARSTDILKKVFTPQ